MHCGYLKLPEDAACVSMIVLSQRNVFHSGPVASQITLHMFEEPGLEVQADSVNLNRGCNRRLNMNEYVKTSTRPQRIYLIRLGVVSHGSCHDHRRVQSVLDALNKCVLFVL